MRKITVALLFCAGIFFTSAAQEPLTVQRGTGVLYGELLMPESVANPPVALFITGVEPIDMDGNSEVSMISSGSLKTLAEDLMGEGIATLRFDRRGVGRSEAVYGEDDDWTVIDLVGDAAAFADLLVADDRLGDLVLIGYGQGATLAEKLTLDHPRVTKLITLYGPGRTMASAIRAQLADAGLPAIYMDELNRVLDNLDRGEKTEDVMADLAPQFGVEFQEMIIEIDKLNPTELMGNITAPVMIVQGDTDLQVDVAEAELLKQANGKALKVVINNMNQVLKFVETTGMNEQMATFMTPGVPNHPELAPAIAKFIKADQRVGFVF